jgi:mRNA interferase MazF
MERGEVRWCILAPPDKERPALLLTNSDAIRFLNSVTVAPITSTIRPVPSQVRLSIEDGMLTDCTVNLHNIQTVAKKKIGRYITTLSQSRMHEVDDAIRFALGMDTDR